jgi:hypothetical protein
LAPGLPKARFALGQAALDVGLGGQVAWHAGDGDTPRDLNAHWTADSLAEEFARPHEAAGSLS